MCAYGSNKFQKKVANTLVAFSIQYVVNVLKCPNVSQA